MIDRENYDFGGRLRAKQEEPSWQDLLTPAYEHLAFVYQRVSTPEQRTNSAWSLEFQDDMANRARRDGYPDHLIYVEKRDLGISGTLGQEDRPGLAYLIQQVEADLVESIYVMEIGRLYRDQEYINAYALGNLLKKHGVIIVTPLMRLNLRIKEHMRIYRMEVERAAEELQVMSNRLHKTKALKAKAGRYCGETLPAGIILDPHQQVNGQPNPAYRQFIIYEPHAEVARLVAARIAAGWSFLETARWCRREGIVFPFFSPEFDTSTNRKSFARSKRTATGWAVTDERILGIVTNPAYIGIKIWGGEVVSETAYPPILEKDTFWVIQERLAHRTATCPKKGNDPLLLAGLLFYRQGEHLTPMSYVNFGNDRNVYCDYLDDDIGVEGTHFTAHILDEPISEAVLAQVALPDLAEEVLSKLTDEYGQARERAAGYRRELRRLESEVRNLQKNFSRPLSDDSLRLIDADIKERMARIRELSDLLSQPIGQMIGHPVPGRADIELVRDFLANLNQLWYTQPSRLQNAFLQLLLNRIIIWCDDPGTIHARLFWRVGLEQELLIHRSYKSSVCWQRQPWSEAEVAVLQEHYATMSKEELMALLPNRAWGGITGKARDLGLTRPAFRRLPRPVAPWFSPEEDELVKRYYAGEVGPTEVLATGRTMDAIRRRGESMGLKRQHRAIWEWIDQGGVLESADTSRLSHWRCRPLRPRAVPRR